MAFMQPPDTPHPNPCRRDEDGKVYFCNGMTRCLDVQPHRGKGLALIEVVDEEARESRVIGMVYKTSRKDNGLVLNACPWCCHEIWWGQKVSKSPKGGSS